MVSESLTLIVQVSWLVLCGMMLFSRFIFQAAGAVWMRSFLDAWKLSLTHRVWGMAALLYGAGLLVGTGLAWPSLTWIDRALALLLVGVLCADGLLNMLPSWFGNFKERMQDSWVKRHRGTERTGDTHLFGTVNLLLGLASALVASLVYWYRPVPVIWLAASVVIALIVMTGLIVGSRLEGRRMGKNDVGVS